VSGRVSPALMVLAVRLSGELIVCAICRICNGRLARGKGMAMRAALGAGVSGTAAMLTESVALSCCGAALGLVLAVVGNRAIAHLDAFEILCSQAYGSTSALGFTLLAAF